MNVKVLTNFCQTPNEKGNNRLNYIANLFFEDGHDVEFITSKFSHRRKKHRILEEEGLDTLNYKFTMLDEPGYKKNVTIKRYYSHYVFGKNVRKYLEKCGTIDLVYCAVPSLDAAFEAMKFCKKRNVKFIIDIQDLWPEAFKMVFKIPIIKDILFYPFEKKANLIYKGADKIVAVSETYIKRAKEKNKTVESLCVYLGTNLEEFDDTVKNEIKDLNKFKVVYAGTLGNSYDLKVLIDSMEILKEKSQGKIELIIIGDGPLFDKLKNYAIEKNIEVNFTGRLPYHETIKIISTCDVGINTLNPGAAQSIINKVGDYAIAGLPVVSNQECEEYRELLIKSNSGLNCEARNPKDMADKIFKLYSDSEYRKKIAQNSRKLGEEKFDRNKTYKEIINVLRDI